MAKMPPDVEDHAHASTLQRVQDEVLAVYQKHNPSFVPIEQREEFERKERFIFTMFHQRLHFPIALFRGRTLLDLGAGTGEQSIFYQRWGARCTLVELNPLSCERAKDIFSMYALEGSAYDIVNQSLFAYHAPHTFDIGLSTGVFHHTAAMEEGIRRLTRATKDGGFVILGICNSAGALQYNLQRAIVYRFAKNEQEIERVAKYLFAEHIERAVHFGRRDEKSVIYDGYVNPKIDSIETTRLLEIFAEESVTYYSSWPPLMPPYLADSARREPLDPQSLPNIAVLWESLWMSHAADDASDCAIVEADTAAFGQAQREFVAYNKDMEPNTIKPWSPEKAAQLATNVLETLKKNPNPLHIYAERRTNLLREMQSVLATVAKGDLEATRVAIAGSRYLFKGSSGLGMTYVIGCKHPTAHLKAE